MILRTLSLVAMLVASTSSWADGTTLEYDLNFDSLNVDLMVKSSDSFASSTDAYKSFQALSNGVGLTVSGWSDTAPNSNDDTNSSGYDQQVTDANLYFYSGGWGVNNDDELHGDHTNHAFDNGSGYSYTNDGKRIFREASADLDMVLLKFDEAVSLTGFSVGWQRSYWDSQTPNQIDQAGVVSITAEDATKMEISNNGSGDVSWREIWDYNDVTRIAEDISGNGNVEQYYNLTGSDTQNHQIHGPGTEGEFSQYWLIGLFNEMENCVDLDSFKLLGVTARTASTTDVPEPASIAVFLIGLTMLYRRQQKQLNL